MKKMLTCKGVVFNPKIVVVFVYELDRLKSRPLRKFPYSIGSSHVSYCKRKLLIGCDRAPYGRCDIQNAAKKSHTVGGISCAVAELQKIGEGFN